MEIVIVVGAAVSVMIRGKIRIESVQKIEVVFLDRLLGKPEGLAVDDANVASVIGAQNGGSVAVAGEVGIHFYVPVGVC